MRNPLLACDRQASAHRKGVLITLAKGTIYKQLSTEPPFPRECELPSKHATDPPAKQGALFTKQNGQYLQVSEYLDS